MYRNPFPVLKALFASLTLVVISGCGMFGGPEEKGLVLSGTIEADDVVVGSKVGGRVQEVLAEEGQRVKQGDVLLRLDDSELRARLGSAEAAGKAAEGFVLQKKAQLALLESGSRPAEVERAKAEWDSVRARLAQARRDAERYEALHAQEAVSTQELERVRSAAEVLAAEEKSAAETYDLMKSGFRSEEIEKARADLLAAVAAVSEARQAKAEAEALFDEMVVRAPGDALVEVLDLRPGDLLGPGRPAAVLVFPERLWVRVYVPEIYLGFMKENAAVEARVDSFPGETFPGTVERINREAEFTPRNIQSVEERVNTVFGVKVRLSDSSGRLRPGMSADVSFPGVPRRK